MCQKTQYRDTPENCFTENMLQNEPKSAPYTVTDWARQECHVGTSGSLYYSTTIKRKICMTLMPKLLLVSP